MGSCFITLYDIYTYIYTHICIIHTKQSVLYMHKICIIHTKQYNIYFCLVYIVLYV